MIFQLSENSTTTPLLSSVIQNLSKITTPGTATETGPLNFKQVIDHIENTPLFQYTGSLTTPPCAEGLTFLVTKEPLPLDVKTYNRIKSVVKFNSRYTQNKLDQDNLVLVGATALAGADGAPPQNGTQTGMVTGGPSASSLACMYPILHPPPL
jgi:carbonic anhydrase